MGCVILVVVIAHFAGSELLATVAFVLGAAISFVSWWPLDPKRRAIPGKIRDALSRPW
jgi:hypothetical protein